MSNLILKYKILIKTITWRIIASSISVLIVFYLTRDFTISLSIGIFETCLKTALYFFHEKYWDSLSNQKMNSKLIRNKISIQKPILIWFTGLPCSGKTTIALSLKRLLQSKGCQTIFLDGDILRNGLNSDLSFSESDDREKT